MSAEVELAPATYGELMLRASRGIGAGVSWMQNRALEEPDLARTAINDFRDVVLALKEHLFALIEFDEKCPGRPW